jgi:WD40 repeat protein
VNWAGRICAFILLAEFGVVPALLAAPATALCFNSDGAILAVGAHRQIELRSIPEGGSTERIPVELSRISSIAFAPGDRSLVVAGGTPGESGAAVILRWNDKIVQHRFTNFSDLVTSAQFNGSGTWLALASADSTAMLYPLGSTGAKSPIALRGHSGPVLGIAWSPGDDLVVTASADRSLKVWSSIDGKLLRSFPHHTEPVHAVVFRPAPRSASDSAVECASASDDGTVRVWQPKIGRMVRIIRGHDNPVFSLAYAPDGRSSLYSAGKDGIIRWLDPNSDQILGQSKAHDEPVYRLAISPTGTHLASGDWAGNVQVWKITDSGLARP